MVVDDAPLKEPEIEEIAKNLRGNAVPDTQLSSEAASSAEPVFALESRELLSSVRVGSLSAPPSYDAVLSALQDVGESDAEMTAFVQANRDLLDYRFLYRLTAEKLRAENTGQLKLSATLDAARMRAVGACQAFDGGLFKQVASAEQRLGPLLAPGKQPSAGEVQAAAGDGPQAVFAFWMVLVAALSAWEARLRPQIPFGGVEFRDPSAAEVDQARRKIAEIMEVRDKLEAATELMAGAGVAPLAPLLALPDMSIVAEEDAAAGSARARSMLNEIAADDETRLAVVRSIGCLAAQAQRHDFKTYNPLVARSAALYDVLLHGRLMPLVACDIESPPSGEPTSRLVKLANDSDQYLKDQGVTLPLFW